MRDRRTSSAPAGLRHHDLRRDVGAGGRHRLDQPRPGLPRHRRPAEVLDAAVAAIRAGHNQYPPGIGIPELRHAIAAHQATVVRRSTTTPTPRCSSPPARPRRSPRRCSRCASRATRSSPSSRTTTPTPRASRWPARTRRVVQLRRPTGRSTPTRSSARSRPRTRVLLLNSPHNPTGKVFAARSSS